MSEWVKEWMKYWLSDLMKKFWVNEQWVTKFNMIRGCVWSCGLWIYWKDCLIWRKWEKKMWGKFVHRLLVNKWVFLCIIASHNTKHQWRILRKVYQQIVHSQEWMLFFFQSKMHRCSEFCYFIRFCNHALCRVDITNNKRLVNWNFSII